MPPPSSCLPIVPVSMLAQPDWRNGLRCWRKPGPVPWPDPAPQQAVGTTGSRGCLFALLRAQPHITARHLTYACTARTLACGGCACAGFRLDPPVLQSMMARHDPDNSGTLSLDEYIRMCLFLQSCVRTFTAFDAQRTGRVVMDFNQ